MPGNLLKHTGEEFEARPTAFPLGITFPQGHKDVADEEEDPGESEPGAFHHLKLFVIVSSYLGMLPLNVKLGSGATKPTFSWFCLPTFMCIAVILTTSTMGLEAAHYFMTTPAPVWGIEAIAIRPRLMVYYLMMPVVLVLILTFCTKFPDLLQEWDTTTKVLRKPMYRSHGPIHMRRSMALLVITGFTAIAIAEHVVRDLSAGTCDDMAFLECYYNTSMEFSSFRQEYNRAGVVTILVIEKFAMLAWNFPSLLVIMLSMSLSFNFRVIAKHIENDVTGQMDTHFRSVLEWKTLREDHLALCRLLRNMDRAISPVTLMTFVINIYWNCVQAYKAVRPQVRVGLENVYFWLSFMLVVVRLGGVSLAGTMLYEQANRPLRYLFHCHPRSYCEEIVSVILTYELILLDSSASS